jgi:hypothetical protein
MMPEMMAWEREHFVRESTFALLPGSLDGRIQRNDPAI